jgi:hypothetical protein
MWIEVCKLAGCGQPFWIDERRLPYGQTEWEHIRCPHCQTVWGLKKSNGVFETRKLTPKEEEDWRRHKSEQ